MAMLDLIPFDIIQEMRAGVQRWLDEMVTWEGKATFESSKEDREMALGAGFLSGEAILSLRKLDDYITAKEEKKHG